MSKRASTQKISAQVAGWHKCIKWPTDGTASEDAHTITTSLDNGQKLEVKNYLWKEGCASKSCWKGSRKNNMQDCCQFKAYMTNIST